MSTINNQFELLGFTNNLTTTQKIANKRSRVSKVLVVAAVVLLATGAYFYGASTANTATKGAHNAFFREYSETGPSRRTTVLPNEGSLGRPLRTQPLLQTTTHKDQNAHVTFNLLAIPQKLKKVEGQDKEVLVDTNVVEGASALWGNLALLKGTKFVSKALNFVVFNPLNVPKAWISSDFEGKEALQGLTKGGASVTICIAGGQYPHCKQEGGEDYSCAAVKPGKDLDLTKIVNNNFGVIKYWMNKDCRLTARLTNAVTPLKFVKWGTGEGELK